MADAAIHMHALFLAAALAGAPVEITTCSVDWQRIQTGRHIEKRQRLWLSFRSTAQKIATEIVFEVSDGDSDALVSPLVEGNFSPNVAIVNRTVDLGFRDIRKPVCSVSSVTYADGSTWEAPK